MPSVFRYLIRHSSPVLLGAALAAAGGAAHASLAIAAEPSAGMVTLTLNSTSAGTGHVALLAAGAHCGTAAQTQAAQDSTGAASLRRGSLALEAGKSARYTLRNLQQSTRYTLCATNGTDTAGAVVSTKAMATYRSATWQVVGSPGFSAGRSENPPSLSIAADGTPYLAFVDKDNGSKTTVMRFDGAAWSNAGLAGLSVGVATPPSLSIAPDGSPYVAFGDGGDGRKAAAMRFDGTAWSQVGHAGFSAAGIFYASLAFAPDGMPYVAFADSGNSDKATVMRFDGAAWGNVGNAGFSSSGAIFLSLSTAPDGTPYLAFGDQGSKTTVMRFDGTAWVNVGNAQFSPGMAYYQSLSFAPDGTPYVAFRDLTDGRTLVMRFDGSAWVRVGNHAMSSGNAYFQSLSVAPDGTPYVAFRNDSQGSRPTVMRFDGTDWVNVGNALFSEGNVDFESLAFSPDGTPYVAFLDGVRGYRPTVMRLIGTPDMPTSVAATAVGSQARVTFIPSASDGGSAVIRYTAIAAPGGASCTAMPLATSCDVAGLAPGVPYTFTVVATNGVGDSLPSAASMPVTPQMLNNSAVPLAGTGAGTAGVVISSAVAGCAVVPGSARFSASAPSGLPTNASLPLGTFSFSATGCSNATVTVQLTYPQSLVGLEPRKFGPPGAGQIPRWFTPGTAALSNGGRTVTYQVTDNGEGDSDLAVGNIADPFAPVLLAAGAAPGSVAAIPTLSEWGLLLLSMGLAWIAWRRPERTRPARR